MDLCDVCPRFPKNGGCALVDDEVNPCDLDHPNYLKEDRPCPRKVCKFGEIGCRYRHDWVLRANIDALSSTAQHQVVTKSQIKPAFLPAPNGKMRDPTVAINHCNDLRTRGCSRGNKCAYLHVPMPTELATQTHAPTMAIPFPSNVQVDPMINQVIQPVKPAAAPAPHQPLDNRKPCKFFAEGKCNRPAHLCKWSHDPAAFTAWDRTVPGDTQSLMSEDTYMSGVTYMEVNDPASNVHVGVPAPATRPPRPVCRNEANGKTCTRNKCYFVHNNPLSKNFNPGSLARQQTQGVQQRARNDHTYDPMQHQLRFELLPQGQPQLAHDRVKDWRPGAQPPNGPRHNPVPNQHSRGGGNRGGRGGRSGGGRGGHGGGISHPPYRGPHHPNGPSHPPHGISHPPNKGQQGYAHLPNHVTSHRKHRH